MITTLNSGCCWLEENVTAASGTEPGATITTSTTAHTKGAYSAGQLIASTAYNSYGITVMLSNVGTAGSTNTRMLCSIATGASGSEQVLIPDLMCGQAGGLGVASSLPILYHFPIFISAGTRLSAAAQTLLSGSSDTVNVTVYLHQHPIGIGGWVGSRVTAYGTNTADSTGTSHSPGNGAYATTTQLSAAITNRIRYMQLGTDLLTNTAGSTARGYIRIASGGSTNYIVTDLPYRESTTLESVENVMANLILSRMAFNIAAGTYLGIGAQRNVAAATRGWAIYAVD